MEQRLTFPHESIAKQEGDDRSSERYESMRLAARQAKLRAAEVLNFNMFTIGSVRIPMHQMAGARSPAAAAASPSAAASAPMHSPPRRVVTVLS